MPRSSKSSAARANEPAPATARSSSAKKAAAKEPAPARRATKAAASGPARSTTPSRPKPDKKSTVKQPTKKSASTSKATKKAAPARPRSPYPAKWLARQQEALVQERETYLQQFESLRAEADSLVADYEPGDVQFDEESGEGDTLSIERERDLTLSNQAGQMVEEIDAALAKIDGGTYGICEVSGEPIPKERLEAIPWARVRVEYKTGGLASRR
jgi:RNA polymerase-binding transcription factor DksA